MTFVPKDPLLTAARWIINFFIAVLGLGIAAIAIGLPAMLLNQRIIVEALVEDGMTAVGPNFFLIAALAMILATILLALGIWFLLLLRQIVNTVAAGDPFTGDNATRLSRMGWIALGEQLLAIPLGAMVMWVAVLVEDHDSVHVDGDYGFSGGGIVLVLVLFILARVFRQGAAMREELEGTV